MTDYTGKMAIGITPEIRELALNMWWAVFIIATVSDDRNGLFVIIFERHLFLVRHPSVNVLAHPWDSQMAVGNWYKIPG